VIADRAVQRWSPLRPRLLDVVSPEVVLSVSGLEESEPHLVEPLAVALGLLEQQRPQLQQRPVGLRRANGVGTDRDARGKGGEGGDEYLA